MNPEEKIDLKKVIFDIYEILSRLEALYESEDIGGLEKSKSDLTRLSVPLEEIYHESNSLYVQAKENRDCKQVEIYKDSRDKGMNVEDAKAEAKFETIGLLKEQNRQQLRRDKSRGLKDQVEEVKIDLAVKIKYLSSKERYN